MLALVGETFTLLPGLVERLECAALLQELLIFGSELLAKSGQLVVHLPKDFFILLLQRGLGMVVNHAGLRFLSERREFLCPLLVLRLNHRQVWRLHVFANHFRSHLSRSKLKRTELSLRLVVICHVLRKTLLLSHKTFDFLIELQLLLRVCHLS